MEDLTQKKCLPCEGLTDPFDSSTAQTYLTDLSGWKLVNNDTCIERAFKFDDFYRTMAFVNAVAWIANDENHHPDLTVGYNYCTVQFMTHAIKGLSENDFICAQKINQLLSN